MISSKLKELVIEIVLKKPGFESIKPEELDESIDKAAISVSRYCRLRQLIEDMKYILADMAADIYKMDHRVVLADSEDDFSGRVKKLTQGDTTIELELETKEEPYSSMQEIIMHYANDLAMYRGIFWR